MHVIINIMPKKGIKKLLPENILIAPINPPNPSDPVSPINTLALLTLKTKNPKSAPIIDTDKIISPCISSLEELERFSCNETKTTKKIKYTTLTPPDNPSSPSVKFTLLVIATKMNATKKIVKTPKFIVVFENGR